MINARNIYMLIQMVDSYQPPPPPKKRSKNALKRAKKRARLDDVNSTGLKTREPAEIDDQVN